MTYRGHLSRAELGLRPPKSRSTNIDASRGGSTGHYAGPDQNVSPILSGHTRCVNLWRGYQNYHMDKHGWVDIAYTLGVCQHGYILAGRGAGVRTAANGTNAGNSYWYAICWIGGQGETPTQDAIDAFWAGVKMLRRDGNAGPGVNKHSDHKSTSCPGNLGQVIEAGEQAMADHNHALEEMPDWGGAEQRYWKKFVDDGVTSAPGSWKNPVHRIDLAWQYSEVFLKLKTEVDRLRSEVKTLRTELDEHKAGHATGEASTGGITQDEADQRYARKGHPHSIKVVTE